MFSAAPATADKYGLGYITERLSDGTRFVWHNGGNRGWNSAFAAVPELGEGIVILTNSDTGAYLVDQVIEAYFSHSRS